MDEIKPIWKQVSNKLYKSKLRKTDNKNKCGNVRAI